MSTRGHGKHPRQEELEAMVRDGRIDTLVVAITDMQGRLMGKRVQADAFLAGVIDHGAHFCTYLLGTDMEMNTPEGFALMNWETGYGDWIAAPVWDSLRVLPWLEKTALVLSDTVDEEIARRDPDLATDDPEAPGRAGDQGRHLGQGRLRVRVLRPQGFVGHDRREWLRDPQALRPVQRGLPPPPGDEGRASPSASPQPDDRGPDPHRVLEGRGRAGPARGQHPLRRRPRVGGPERPLQARGQGDRLPQRLGHHLHGQARPHLDGLFGPSPHEHLGPGRQEAVDPRRDRTSCPTASAASSASSWPG